MVDGRRLGQAWRVLTRRPLTTALSILCLGLGIGATTVVFSLVSGVLLTPMPYTDAERIHMLWTHFPETGQPRSLASGWEFLDFREQAQVFDEVGGLITWMFNVTGSETPRRVIGARASASLFRLLSLDAARGRIYTEEEEVRGDPVVVLGHAFWQRSFGGDPEILGQKISLNQVPHTVIGILGPEVRPMPPFAELWVPLVPNPAVPRNMRGVMVLTKLRDGIDRRRAQADLDTLELRFAQDHPEIYPEDRGWGLSLEPLRDTVVRDVEGRLLTFLGAVALVLLIACANVASLLLAQATTREKEMALRSALGARRRALLGQLLTESLLLAVAGGLLGILLALAGTRLLAAFDLGKIPRLEEVTIDGRVLLFSLGVSLLCGILCGLAPALRLSATQLVSALKEGGQRAAGSTRHPLRRLLVVVEIALAVVVLVGTLLTLASFRHLQREDPGFRTEGIRVLQLNLSPGRYPDDDARRTFARQLSDGLEALPGLSSHGITSHLPMGRTRLGGPVRAEGAEADAPTPNVGWRMIDSAFFSTLEIPILDGRAPDSRDHEGAEPVVVIEERTARRLWPDRDPLGQRLQLLGDAAGDWRRVIGVVGAVKQQSLAVEAREQIYLPFGQMPSTSVGLVLAPAGDPERLAPALRELILRIDPEQPLDDLRDLEQMAQESLAGPRFNSFLFVVFGSIAFLLAAVGVYGLMAHTVAQRRHEIGLRRALGATRGTILSLILGDGMRLAAIGLTLGLGVAWLLARALERLLSELAPGVAVISPATVGPVALLLLATVALACLVPARRALNIGPMDALRRG